MSVPRLLRERGPPPPAPGRRSAELLLHVIGGIRAGADQFVHLNFVRPQSDLRRSGH